jgi:enoyl-CoA hydratase/carnithine racemase
MAVSRIDPRVVTSDEELRLALAPLVGPATCLRFDGAWPATLPGAAAATLASLPVLTIGVDAPAGLISAFDLACDAAEADRIEAAFARAPLAAVSAATLLRHPPAGTEAALVAESTTYSMLQGGPEFASWRAARPRRPVDDAGAPRVRVDGGARSLEITLTRAGRHNALDVAMRDELWAALDFARVDGRPVLLHGEGPSFCSGGDLDEFGTFEDAVSAHAVRLDRSLARACALLSDRLVAALHGSCLGAGIELPAFARCVIAADDARIGLPEQAIGLLPGAGGTVSIRARAGAPAVLRLLLRDDPVDATTAAAMGVVDEVVPRGALLQRARELVATLA